MARDIIKLTEEENISLRDNKKIDGFELTEEIPHYYMGSTEYDLIFMKESDGRFFKTHGKKLEPGKTIYEPELVEVFPCVRTIITYE